MQSLRALERRKRAPNQRPSRSTYRLPSRPKPSPRRLPEGNCGNSLPSPPALPRGVRTGDQLLSALCFAAKMTNDY